MKATSQKPADSIRALAIAFKIVATIEAIGFAIIFTYGLIVETHAPVHAIPFQLIVFPSIIALIVVVLAIVPNRWIVRSPILYLFSLFMAALPYILSLLSAVTSISSWDFEGACTVIAILILILPWPLSLLLSSIRFKKGESFWYA
jgi:hypothetical protein